MSDEFGVSRAPIREALRQLEQEGMVEYTRNVGCSVREITLDDMYEIYLLCATYECMSVQLCRGVFSEEEIARLEGLLKEMEKVEDLQELGAVDHAMHRLIVEKAGFSRIIKAWEHMSYGNLISLFTGGMGEKASVKASIPIHRELVDACRTNDERLICRTIYDHYMHTIRRRMKDSGISGERVKTLRQWESFH